MDNKSFEEILNDILLENSGVKVNKSVKPNLDELYAENYGFVSFVERLQQVKKDGTRIELPKSFQTNDAVSQYYGKISSPKSNIMAYSV